ncbi:TolC family protein [Aquabacterium sp. A7-Y]|uniref:TolC family protein n=1 Tax=Aquabacterium sp. A7-Y TaxID=1349605 RepID=UPI00223E2203|nr:TolC family protein [Aquabacterium sp. A7-Y]MCW7541916.1 TolC family protein [Aquabacterium sp. A7-Y]
MNIHRWFAPGLLAGAVCCSVIAAEPVVVPGTSLAHAVEAAWQRATVAAESRGREREANAARAAATAWTPAAPALTLEHRSDRLHDDRGARETELGVSVPLWRLGQRGARQADAEAQASAARASAAATRLALAGEVRFAAWALASEQAALQSARQEQQTLQRLADDTDRRVAAGDLARADGMAARAELLAAQGAVAQARQALTVARSRWTALTGLSGPVDPSEPGAAAAEAQPPASHPELLSAEAEVERTRHHLDALRQARRSPPELTVSARQESAARGEPRERSLGVALRLPIGVDAGSRELEAEALSRREVAEVALQRVRERLVARLTEARGGLEAAQHQLTAEQSRAALLRERARLLDTSFQAGETALPDLLRALSAAHQADAAVARQQAALGLARARLHQALGLMP